MILKKTAASGGKARPDARFAEGACLFMQPNATKETIIICEV